MLRLHLSEGSRALATALFLPLKAKRVTEDYKRAFLQGFIQYLVSFGLLHEHDELLPRDLAALELWHLRLACALHHADCREERLAINKEW